MSRGPGRIERAIERLFAEQKDGVFSIADMAPYCYPGLVTMEKKHQIAILRAAEMVCDRMEWFCRRTAAKGHPFIYYNTLNQHSLAVGSICCETGLPPEICREMLEGPNAHPGIRVHDGSFWARIVDYNRLLKDGRDAEADAVLARIEEEREAWRVREEKRAVELGGSLPLD